MGAGSLDLAGWRRRMHETYAEVRRLATADPAAAHNAWRAGRDALYAGHPDSPLPAGDPRRRTGLPVAAYDPAWRFELPLLPAPTAHLDLPTATDGVAPFDRLGRIELPGELGSLDVWWLGTYGGGLWLPARDGGSGSLSYGGGRYLLDSVKGADLGSSAGRLVVDLNFLYHPSCAYDEAWACPLAPGGNRIAAVVPVGELSSPELTGPV